MQTLIREEARHAAPLDKRLRAALFGTCSRVFSMFFLDAIA
jgi:hypothetical protein